MQNIKFTLAARCEAAGRENNEDNYQVIADIATDKHGFTTDEELTLGELGTLLVACDGMGGMNAGEVASAIAVQTIKDCFAREKLTKDALNNPERYITTAIQAADAAIKAESKRNPETEGMGCTVVLMWLLGGKIHVGWCGDSRAYRYNALTGLERLSHDHSYVQELVDAGSITEELAFFHPNNNIITRSLGDPHGVAQPDTMTCYIQEGDMYLLCSDGLCGCLQDHQIQEVIKQHHTTVSECRDALWAADEAAGWHDNVTTILVQITEGGIATVRKTDEVRAQSTHGISTSTAELLQSNRRLKWVIACLVAVVLASIIGIICILCIPSKNAENNGGPTEIVTEQHPQDNDAVASSTEKATPNSIEKDKKVQPKKGLQQKSPESARLEYEQKQVREGVKLAEQPQETDSVNN